MTSTFDDYLYRFYIYSGVCCVDYYSLFPTILERLPLRFLVSARKVKSMNLVLQGIGLGDEHGVRY